MLAHLAGGLVAPPTEILDLSLKFLALVLIVSQKWALFWRFQVKKSRYLEYVVPSHTPAPRCNPSYRNAGSSPLVAAPFFNCLANMSPVVKVSSKKVKNCSRYLESPMASMPPDATSSTEILDLHLWLLPLVLIVLQKWVLLWSL